MLFWVHSAQTRSRKFVFLDRDGVINEDRPDYIKHWEEVRFYPDALEALRRLNEMDVQVILISNQSGLNRGIIGSEAFRDIHRRMVRHIRDCGGDVLAAFYCPHMPHEHCRCRKPAPGMIRKASGIFGIPLENTFMIGDRWTDVEAAENAGCRAILLDRSEETQPHGVSASEIEKRGLMRFSNLSLAVEEAWKH
ncbi:MAG: HAD family hydrolase [Deltaproteobacteria bacterium]|nr:HAD family hydrolase [Deltaproteobacteria bacterium]